MNGGLSVKDAAKELGVSIGMIYKLVGRRLIGHYRFGRRIVFAERHIRDYLNGSEVTPSEEDLWVGGLKHLDL